MATFDQLPPDQRAIIELVVQRGRSYDSLADVLEIPPARVRELARDALARLAPVTAGRVDPEWRGQLSDYMLGQQTGPEATATRGHLKRSEPARAWAMSLLDSLDALYPNGARPAVPDADNGTAPKARLREERGRAAAPEPATPEPGATPPVPSPDRRAERDRERAIEKERAARGDLSPAARSALLRRRLIGAALALLLVVAAVLLATGAFSSGKKSGAASARRTSGPQARVVGTLALTPVGPDTTAKGIAVIAKRGNQTELIVQAQMQPTKRGTAYEVWLYNSPTDVASLGAQVTDAQGRYQGAGPLSANYQRFKYIDISLEQIGRSTAHNGPSVLRGALASLQAPTGATTPAP